MKWLCFFSVLLLIGCKQTVNKVAWAKPTISVHNTVIKSPPKQIDTDSINEGKALKQALLYSLKRKSEDSFRKKLAFGYDTALYAKLIFGNLFSNHKKHLVVINQVNNVDMHINIFTLDKGNFRQVLSIKTGCLVFMHYNIKDVNGDGEKDFMYDWYPESGCCMRDICDVYLYQSNSGDFSKNYELTNPTFFNSEKIIRGVGYGHPGDVELYKYKWNGNKVDTIEFIYPDTTIKKYHVYYHFIDFDDPKKGRFISAIPKEYHHIRGYSWFEGGF